LKVNNDRLSNYIIRKTSRLHSPFMTRGSHDPEVFFFFFLKKDFQILQTESLK